MHSDRYTLQAMFHVMKLISSTFHYQDRTKIFTFLQEDSGLYPHANVNALPNEMVTKILSYLPKQDLARKVPLLSKRLRTLSQTPSLWKDLTVTSHYSFASNLSVVEKLISRCTLLRTLKLSWQMMDAVKISTKALRTCRGLLELSLTPEAACGAEDLSQFFTAIKESVSLRRLCIEFFKQTRALAENAGCLANLTDITIWSREDNGLLRAVGAHCRRLESFQFSRFDREEDVAFFLERVRSTIRSVTYNGYMPITDGCVKGIERCELLKTLVIPMTILGGTGLGAICRLSSLRTLNLSSSLSITDSDLVDTMREARMQSLTSLDLSWCDGLRDAGLVAIVESCPGIKVLDLYGCCGVTSAGVSQVLGKCVELKELDLRSIPEVSRTMPEAVSTVVNAPLEILALSKSRELNGHMGMIRGKLPHLRKLTLQ